MVRFFSVKEKQKMDMIGVLKVKINLAQPLIECRAQEELSKRLPNFKAK